MTDDLCMYLDQLIGQRQHQVRRALVKEPEKRPPRFSVPVTERTMSSLRSHSVPYAREPELVGLMLSGEPYEQPEPKPS